MRLRPGEKINQKFEIISLIACGGQGSVYLAKELNTNKKIALKVFSEQFNKVKTTRRLDYLISQTPKFSSSVLVLPIEKIQHPSWIGYYSNWIEGEPLEDVISKISFDFREGLVLTIALCHAVNELHNAGIAHGDLHSQNVFVHRQGKKIELFLIDLDNFVSSGVEEPPCIGNLLYFAPEIRKTNSLPDIKSELYSLAILIHEILLLRHPATISQDSEIEFERTMTSGRWPEDPMQYSLCHEKHGGNPVRILNTSLMRLFRKSFAIDKYKRPTANEWLQELCIALHELFICPQCENLFLVDASKTSCPWCKNPYPPLKLVLHKKQISLNSGRIQIGRKDLISPSVSKVHAVLRKVGPETWIESLGVNGTYLKQNNIWIKLPNSPTLLKPGDHLRFADVEARLMFDKF